MLRTFAAVLLGLSLTIQSHTVFADAIPYPAVEYDWGRQTYGSPRLGGHPSADAACEAGYIGFLFVFEYSTMDMPPYGYAMGHCWYSRQDRPDLGIQHYDVYWTRYLSCPQGGHPDDISLQKPNCVCPPGYDFDTTVPDTPGWGVFACKKIPVVAVCSVNDLLPKPTDACSVSLEASFGTPGPACPPSAVMTDPNGHSCFRAKMALLGTNYAGPTAQYRTPGYQNHLVDIWDKDVKHKQVTDPAMRVLCAERRTAVENEMKAHGITDEPYGDSHSTGRAFDVSNPMVDKLVAGVTAGGIPGWLGAPPPCNLRWLGVPGTLPKPDRVHFQTP